MNTKYLIKQTSTALIIVSLIACGGGGGDGGNGGGGNNVGNSGPSADEVNAAALAGTWLVYEASGPNDCGEQVSLLSTYTATISASGSTLTAELPNGSLSGTLVGTEIALTGTLTEGSGSSAVTLTFTVLGGNMAAGGASEFVYSETGFSCSGENIVGAIKQANGNGSAIASSVDLNDDWTITETSGENSCGDAVGIAETYTVSVSQADTFLYISTPDTGLEGEIHADTGVIAAAYTDQVSNINGASPLSGGKATAKLQQANFADLVSIAGFTVSQDGDSFEGVGGFTFVDSFDEQCAGVFTISGTRNSLPAQPTNLTVTTDSSSSLTLNWQDNADNETGYDVYRLPLGSASASAKRLVNNNGAKTFLQLTQAPTRVAQLSANSTSYTDTSLLPNYRYEYFIKALNQFGETESEKVEGVTDTNPEEPAPEPPSPLLAPTGLTATTVSSSSINLSWNDNSSNETGYRVYRANSSGSLYTEIATLGPNAESYTATSLSASTTYYFYVSVYGTGNSKGSNTASATTSGPIVTVPVAPTNMMATNITSSSVTLTWSDNSNNETGFRILVCGLASTNGGCFSYNLITTTAANATSYTRTGLTAGATYIYYVQATNSAGNSTSTSVQFTTTAAQSTQTVYATFDNLLLTSNVNTTWQNNNYPGGDIAVGCNWEYSFVTGLQTYVCGATELYFNIDSLIDGKNIISATLKLYPYILPADFNDTYQIRAIAQDWDPSSVTYANQPNVFTSPVIIVNPPTTTAIPMEFDVTNIVQSWANGTRTNYGFQLSNTNVVFPLANVLRSTSIESLEVNNGSTRRPQLELTIQ